MTPNGLQDLFLPQELIKFLDQAGRIGHLWVPLNIPGTSCDAGAIIEVIGFVEGFPEPTFKISPRGKNVSDCYPQPDGAELFKVITSDVPAASFMQNKKFKVNPQLALTIYGAGVQAGANFSRVKNVDLELKEVKINWWDLVKVNSWSEKVANRYKVDLTCIDQLLLDKTYVVHEAFTIKGTYTLKDDHNQQITLNTPADIKNFIKIDAKIDHSNTTDGKLEINQPTVIAIRRVARVGRLYGEYVFA